MSRDIDKRVSRAGNFRKDPTDAERKLWQRLRHLQEVHFRRQATIGPYFADFACHTTHVIVEVDGGQHAKSASDKIRTAYLENHGYRVLRFWDHDVLTNIEGVMEIIVSAMTQMPPTPDPSPSRQECVGGGESVTLVLPSSRSCGGEGSGVGGPLDKTSTNNGSIGGNA